LIGVSLGALGNAYQGIEYFGLALFAFAVLFDFGLIRRAYGVQERAAEESATDDGSNIAA